MNLCGSIKIYWKAKFIVSFFLLQCTKLLRAYKVMQCFINLNIYGVTRILVKVVKIGSKATCYHCKPWRVMKDLIKTEKWAHTEKSHNTHDTFERARHNSNKFHIILLDYKQVGISANCTHSGQGRTLATETKC